MLSRSGQESDRNQNPFDGGASRIMLEKGVTEQQARDGIVLRYLKDGNTEAFRSSFRTWCVEEADARWEVAEACFAHNVGGKVERPYKLIDCLE